MAPRGTGLVCLGLMEESAGLNGSEAVPNADVTTLRGRRIGMTLVIAGSLPFIAAVAIVVSAFALPALCHRVVEQFVPPNVDVPDNWAVAITRMVQLFIISGGIGVCLSATGRWLLRRAP